jgi:hypothetical protein
MPSRAAQTWIISTICRRVLRTMNTPRRGSVRRKPWLRENFRVVHFDAANSGRLDEDWVQIQILRAHDEMVKHLNEWWRNRKGL